MELLDGAHGDSVGDTENGNRIAGNADSGVQVGETQLDLSQNSPELASELTFNGPAFLQGTQLALTGSSLYAYQSNTVFTSQRVSVSNFTTQFQFQIGNPNATGFTFTIQGDGPSTVDERGFATSIGYVGGAYTGEGIGNSVAVTFDVNDQVGSDTTALYAEGSTALSPVASLSASGINLASGDFFQADVSYDGTTLLVTITDMETGKSASQSYQVNIPSFVGGSSAYVGFTTGTNQQSFGETILNWKFSEPPVRDNVVAGNVITQNEGPGIELVGNSATGNQIIGNEIFANQVVLAGRLRCTSVRRVGLCQPARQHGRRLRGGGDDRGPVRDDLGGRHPGQPVGEPGIGLDQCH